MFGVFILTAGAWKLWATYGGPISARQERDYLVNQLGIFAQVFKREA